MSDFFVHPSSIIDKSSTIGNSTKIWHWSHISEHSKIGKNCTIGQNVFIGEGVKIGDNVKIQNNVSIFSGVRIEDNVFCGPSVVFTNVKNPRSNFPAKEYQKTIVKTYATIGGNSTIVCGTIIGEYAFIGAGSVVTKNIADYTMVYGNPAKKKGMVGRLGFKLDKNYFCKYENKSYSFLKKK